MSEALFKACRTGEKSNACALARLATQEGETVNMNNTLLDMGVRHGLTEYQCYGIMDGWDTSRAADDMVNGPKDWCGYFAANADQSPEEYSIGFAWGQECYRIAKENDLVR